MTDIQERIATLARHQTHMRTVDGLLKAGRDGDLKTLGYTDAQIARLKEPDLRGRIGFAQSIQSNRQKLHRLRRKLKGMS